MTKALLIIDPQNDFMDNPPGSLAVNGATNDMKSLASYIDFSNFDEIFVTLDTHRVYHIAHRSYWVNSNGEHPAPFTEITLKDFEQRKYFPVDEEKNNWVRNYLSKLADDGKYKLMIWPEHCIENTNGHNVQPNLLKSLENWEKVNNKKVNYVKKGMNPNTESYSVFKAEVPTSDTQTHLKTDFLNKLNKFDSIEVAGEALSHCVASSCEDLISYVNPEKVTILSNYCSSVTGFEENGQKFLEKMKNSGVNVKQKESSLKLKM